MGKHKKHKSTLARIKIIGEITQKHYEEGRQDKCYKAVWRSFIFPTYKIDYRTFLSYINTPTGDLNKEIEENPNQLKLF